MPNASPLIRPSGEWRRRVLAIKIERTPRHFRSENRAQFSSGPSDSIAISGARKSRYWPAYARLFVIAGTANGQIGTAWRREGDLNSRDPSAFDRRDLARVRRTNRPEKSLFCWREFVR
jgi:hypothetical protein